MRLLRVAALVLCVVATRALAQGEPEVEVITEPPAQPTPTQPGPEVEPEAEPQPDSQPTTEPESEPTTVPEPRPERSGRLRVGAGLGLGFGTNLITVGISPQVSYLFKKIVEPGVALRYQYTNDKLPDPPAVWHTYGGSIFVRLYPLQPLFILVEGELINTGFRQGDVRSGRVTYGNLFLGGGYVMGVGRGAFVAVSLKINVFRNPFYPRNIPIFGVGAGFTF